MSSEPATAVPEAGREPAAAPPRRRLRGALRLSFADGAVSRVTYSLAEPFAVPAILALGAKDLGVAVMAGVGMLLPALANLASPRLTAMAPSRRGLVVAGARLQALACLFFAGAGFLPATWGIAACIICYAAYQASGSAVFGTWAAWLGELVPKSGRSRYFALRNLVYGPIGALTMLGAGLTLRAAKGEGRAAPWVAFAALLALAGAMRLLASLLVARQYQPPEREKFPAEDFSYRQFLAKAGASNFARFTLVYSFFVAAASMTSAFFQKYVLDDLGYGYVTYTLLQIAAMASGMLFVRFWARVADRWGNLLVMRLCALTIALIPVLYLGGRWLPPLAAGWLLGGACWAGLDLASFNYVTDVATPRRRVRCYAYMQATVGIAGAFCTLLFGALVKYEAVPVIFHFRLQTVFLISMVLRLGGALAFMLMVREVAAKPEARPLELLYELPAVRRATDLLRDLARPFNRG